MSTSPPPSASPSPFAGYDHLHLWVSNAKQAATYYIVRFGFTPLAYRGLETGSREVATHVVKQNDVILAFSSPLNPVETDMGRRIMITGDAVKDVAFTVDDCAAVYSAAVERGAKSILAPVRIEDKDGHVVLATIQTYGDTTHTLVQRRDYHGAFLPGYTRKDAADPLSALLPSPNLLWIDHVVGNQPDQEMMGAVNWSEKGPPAVEVHHLALLPLRLLTTVCWYCCLCTVVSGTSACWASTASGLWTTSRSTLSTRLCAP